MTARHPTAAIDQAAKLADSVSVGPQCVIEGDVTIGENTKLVGHVYLQGPLTIGSGNTIYPFATIGFAGQDLKFDPQTAGPGVVIGNDNVFRESVTIHRATGDQPTTIGHRNYFMVASHVGHDSTVGDDNMLANNALIAGHVHLADRCVLGGCAGIHQFCKVGRLCMISGNSGIGKDMPPFCTSYTLRTVGSLNLVGLRRAGYRDHIQNLQRAFDILFVQGHAREHACDLIDAEFPNDVLCNEFATFARQSERGIVQYSPTSKF